MDIQPLKQSLEKKQEECENKYVMYHKGKLIKDMELESEITEVKFHLLKIAQSFGIANVPSDEHLTMLVAFIKRNFMWFTRQEISYAFELYALGELDCIKQHYQTLNVEFVAAVLKAYQLKRFPHLRDADEPKKALPQGNQFGAPEVTQEMSDEFHFNIVKKYCDENGKVPILANWQQAYSHLERVKLIEMSNEDKREYMEQIKEREAMRIGGSNAGWIEVREGLNQLNNKEDLKLICRREIAIDYFKKYLHEKKAK